MLNKQHQSKWTQMDCEDDQQIQVYKPYSPIPYKNKALNTNISVKEETRALLNYYVHFWQNKDTIIQAYLYNCKSTVVADL